MMPIDRLAATNRWRRRHAVDKLVLGGGLLLLALLLPPWPGAPLILAAAALAAIRGAGISPADFARLLLLPAGFLAAGWLALAITVPVDPAAPLLAITPASAGHAAKVSARALAATAALLFLVVTTPVTDLLGHLSRMGVPSAITDIALLMYRLIFLTADQAGRIRLAQTGRLGYGTRRLALRSTGQLAAALLPRVLERAHRMETGLAARAYAGEIRTLPSLARPSRPFLAAALAVHGGIVAVTIAVRGLATGPGFW